MDRTETSDNRALLRRFLEAETGALLGALHLYVVRAGLANGQGATLAAVELLNDVAVEALACADRFRPAGQPRAWLLGIAANLIKRRQVERAKRNRREPLIHDLFPDSQDAWSEDELFDRLAAFDVTDPAHSLAVNQELDAILAHISEGDQQVLRLAVLHGLSGLEMAQALGITPGAARVRLHRALNRLREAWERPEQGKVESHG
jgi:RNA polymerase sigma factor (sigma-70 family)